jgi:hypothetical protein
MATNPKAVSQDEPDDRRKQRLRSPAYPYINLETAIARAQAFYDIEIRSAVPITLAAKDWGYEAKSSAAMQTAAALMSFGLMSDEGTGDKRKVRLTQNALKILLDKRPDSIERAALIKQAALAPKIHQQIWEKLGGGVSDGALRHSLIFEWNPPFNENSVDGFIREFRDTIAFAKLAESDKVATEDGSNEESRSAAYVPKLGDYVQWESQGALQCEPVKVLRISTDGAFAFVEGTSTGLPVQQLIPASASAAPPPHSQIARVTSLPTTTMQEDVYSLPEGRIVVQWPTVLSVESVQEVKDYLKLLERKIVRSTAKDAGKEPPK